MAKPKKETKDFWKKIRAKEFWDALFKGCFGNVEAPISEKCWTCTLQNECVDQRIKKATEDYEQKILANADFETKERYLRHVYGKTKR